MGIYNVQIKKEDKYKVVFIILERSFEPIIVFFGLTNSLVIFQTMINEILWNLINTGEVASLINDIIVRTEEKKGHDEVVEEIIEERLVENDLYIKLEKCK